MTEQQSNYTAFLSLFFCLAVYIFLGARTPPDIEHYPIFTSTQTHCDIDPDLYEVWEPDFPPMGPY